jgi:hypothetical protein
MRVSAAGFGTCVVSSMVASSQVAVLHGTRRYLNIQACTNGMRSQPAHVHTTSRKHSHTSDTSKRQVQTHSRTYIQASMQPHVLAASALAITHAAAAQAVAPHTDAHAHQPMATHANSHAHVQRLCPRATKNTSVHTHTGPRIRVHVSMRNSVSALAQRRTRTHVTTHAYPRTCALACMHTRREPQTSACSRPRASMLTSVPAHVPAHARIQSRAPTHAPTRARAQAYAYVRMHTDAQRTHVGSHAHSH